MLVIVHLKNDLGPFLDGVTGTRRREARSRGGGTFGIHVLLNASFYIPNISPNDKVLLHQIVLLESKYRRAPAMSTSQAFVKKRDADTMTTIIFSII